MDKQIIIDNYFRKIVDINGKIVDYEIKNSEVSKLVQKIEKYNSYIERKEQECKDLREDIKDIANLLDLDTGEEYNFGNIEIAIKGLKQECERLKNERTVDLVKQLDQLKAENEKLKANNEMWKTIDIIFDNGIAKTQISDMSLAEYSDIKLERDRAEQKLARIREMATALCYKVMSDGVVRLQEDILQIIEEVE